MSALTNWHPDVPTPAGAVTVGRWLLDGGEARHFRGTKRGGAETTCGCLICVDIEGDQFVDRTIDRYVELSGGHRLDSTGARALAADLLAAADELDELGRSENPR